MLKKIFQLFRSKTANKPLDPLYNFLFLDKTEIEAHPDGLKDIFDRRIDGMIIRNVLSPDEIQEMVQQVRKLKAEKFYKLKDGFHTYPQIFTYMAYIASQSPELLTPYFKDCKAVRQTFPKDFKIDIEQRLSSIFQTMGGGRAIKVPIDAEQTGSYMPTTIRCLEPNGGRLNIHTENANISLFAGFFEHLSTIVQVDGHISYFIMLNPAELGGELNLYDIEWKDAQEKVGENLILKRLDGSEQAIDKLRQRKLTPQAGDMVLFAAGQIWHRVMDIKGAVDRITVGGFLGLSPDEKSIYYWS